MRSGDARLLQIDAVPPGAGSAEAGCAIRRTAVVAVHGMGQQVPYETLSVVAEGIVEEAVQSQVIASPVKVTVDLAQLAGDRPPLARARFRVPSRREENGSTVDVHVYEAYWAPLTAGKASFVDAVWFLIVGAFNGLWCRLRGLSFRRWMFGGFQELPIKPASGIAILLALVGLGVVLFPALVLIGYWRSILSLATDGWRAWASRPRLFALSLVTLAGYTALLRYVMIEFVGDVAIYISAHKVSRFEETRHQIQDVTFNVLRQVFEATRADGAWEYDDVVLVGHSLGSVIAYDILNAAISWDRDQRGGRVRVVDRTRRLITVGSPLEKTAYLFRAQLGREQPLRESMAALKQPLILDYAQFRPAVFRWVNIYSPADVISGSLTYYDTPVPDNVPAGPSVAESAAPQGGRSVRNPVQNVVDRRAWIPFVAHVQYWRNAALRQQLLDAVAVRPLG